eukprot:GHVS01014278.1.p1 GENE.GHVS01014278.1~~GHVS01014278.1.p1  ORF type:complete len:247 (-),score=93.59 GHVS01014278.1:194-934(-)
MGKRKSRAAVPSSRKIPKLDTSFDCPFCSHLKAVDIKINRKFGTAELWCRLCGSSYECTASRLEHPIDVFSRWIDRCQEEQERSDALEAVVGTTGGAGGLAGGGQDGGYNKNRGAGGRREGRENGGGDFGFAGEEDGQDGGEGANGWRRRPGPNAGRGVKGKPAMSEEEGSDAEGRRFALTNGNTRDQQQQDEEEEDDEEEEEEEEEEEDEEEEAQVPDETDLLKTGGGGKKRLKRGGGSSSSDDD